MKYLKSVFAIILLFCSVALCGCSVVYSSSVTKMSKERNTPTEMSMTHQEFSGNKQGKIKVKENKEIEVTVEITTTSGKLDVYIALDNDKDNADYIGNDIQTTSFVVTLSRAGNYVICVDGENHCGSYSFKWEK